MSLFKYDERGRIVHEVFALEPGEEVGCYYCMSQRWGDRNATYKRGEAFLCGADHPPCDANANYICKNHLSEPYEIVDLHGVDSSPERKS